MKKNFHPTSHIITAECVCGNSFETRSTMERLKVDICSKCHPFFSGIAKFVDRAGRIERFQSRYQAAGKKS